MRLLCRRRLRIFLVASRQLWHGNWLLTTDFFCGLVFAQPLKRSLAYAMISCPCGELDLCHQFRLYPNRIFLFIRSQFSKWRFGLPQFIETFPQCFLRSLSETRACTTCVCQLDRKSTRLN